MRFRSKNPPYNSQQLLKDVTKLSKLKLSSSIRGSPEMQRGTDTLSTAHRWSRSHHSLPYILGVCKYLSATEWMKSIEEWVLRGKVNLFWDHVNKYHLPFHRISYWVLQHYFPYTCSYKVPITTPILWSSDTNVLYLEFSPSLWMHFKKLLSLPIFCCSCRTKSASLNLCFVRLNL